MNMPTLEAVLVADNRLFLLCHRKALNILPPSIGKAGNKLKKPNAMFEIPEYNKVAKSHTGNDIGEIMKNTKKVAPNNKELSGPTKEMINSFLAVLGSSSIFDTPPNKYNSISLTLSP